MSFVEKMRKMTLNNCNSEDEMLKMLKKKMKIINDRIAEIELNDADTEIDTYTEIDKDTEIDEYEYSEYNYKEEYKV